MSFKFTFEVEGVPVLVRSFHRVGQHLSDLRPIWPNVQREFWKIESAQFKSEGAKGAGGKWKSLSRPYAKQKAQRFGVQPILRASGRLESSLTGQTSDTVLITEPQVLTIGSSVPYGKYHQTGTGKMPKRPVIDFSDQQKRDLSKGIQRDLLTEIKRDPQIKLEVT